MARPVNQQIAAAFVLSRRSPIAKFVTVGMTDTTVAAGVTAIVDPLLCAVVCAPVDPAHYLLLQPATRAISTTAARRPSRRTATRRQIPATRTHSAARRQVPARPPVVFASAVKGVAGVARVVGVAGEAAATPLHASNRPRPAPSTQPVARTPPAPGTPPAARAPPAPRTPPVARTPSASRRRPCPRPRDPSEPRTCTQTAVLPQIPPPPADNCHPTPISGSVSSGKGRRCGVGPKGTAGGGGVAGLAAHSYPCCPYPVVPRQSHPWCPYPVPPVFPCCPPCSRAAPRVPVLPLVFPCCPALPVLPRSACVVPVPVPCCPVQPLSCPVLPVQPRCPRVAPFCPCCPVQPVSCPVQPVFCPVLPVLPRSARVLPRSARVASFSPCPALFSPSYALFCPCCPVQPVSAPFSPCCPVLPVLPCSARVLPRSARVLPCSARVAPFSPCPAPFCPSCPVQPVSCPVLPVLPCSARAAPFCPFVPYPCCPYPFVPHPVCAARSRAARHSRAARPVQHLVATRTRYPYPCSSHTVHQLRGVQPQPGTCSTAVVQMLLGGCCLSASEGAPCLCSHAL
ncbi:unnamed protein product [Closterium sp. NIES-65]|nr:unnamed protein product [Closterium sp. NIES-65]